MLELAVQGRQVGAQRRGAGGVVGGVVRVGLAEPLGELVADAGQPGRVEPDVRVLAAALLGVPLLALVVVPAGGRVQQRLHAGHVERPVAAVLRDGVVHRRLETLEVDDQLRVADLADLARVELQVVRLGAGLGQVGHPDRVAADPLGEELEGVERGHHVDPLGVGAGGAAGGAAGPGAQGEEGGRGGQDTVRGAVGHVVNCPWQR